MAHPLPGLAQRLRPDDGDRKRTATRSTSRTRRRSPRACISCPRSSSEAAVSDLHRHTPDAARRRTARAPLLERRAACAPTSSASTATRGAERLHLRHAASRRCRTPSRRSRARRRHRSGRSHGVPIAHKDIFCTRGCAPPAARACSITSSRRTMPPSSRGSRPPAPSCSARRTWMSSPWARPTRPATTDRCAIPGTWRACPAARRRFGGRRGGAPGARRHRDRHRRLDPPARRARAASPASSPPTARVSRATA